MTCTHRGKRLATISTKAEPITVYRCDQVQGSCVESAAMLQQMPGSMSVSCEGCPLYQAAVSESERAFQGTPWGRGESLSGPGSALDSTRVIREALPGLLQDLGCQSLLDIPCGDHHWMSQTDLDGIKYIGADVVRGLVESNTQRYGWREFRHIDLTTDTLPTVDAILVRDCLVHLPYEMISQALSRIVESGAKWVIMTHFPGRTNHDIQIGSWRPLDMTAKPFYLPEPARIINEGCTEGQGAYADKSLGVWSVESIRDALKRGPKLTIGMAYYRDWPGLWATVNSLLMHHAESMRDVEIVVVDNDPDGDPSKASESNHSWKARSLCEQVGARYEHFTTVAGTAAAKGRIFGIATAPAVLVMDCHVMLPPGTVGRLIEWFDDNPDSRDLLQGPLIAGTQVMATHMRPTWGSLMRGQWEVDHQALKSDEPLEIEGHGCGLFAMLKKHWPGFHPLLKGFGPEEFHIHARVRRAGGKCYSMPWLRWNHRFGNPDGAKPPGLSAEDRLRGHIITSLDTGEYSLEEIRRHFVDEARAVTAEMFDDVLNRTRAEFDGPSLLVKGMNFTKAIGKWAAAGMPVCPPEKIAERLSRCQTCPNLVDNACKLCGCPINGETKLRNKLALATEKCPMNPPRWT